MEALVHDEGIIKKPESVARAAVFIVLTVQYGQSSACEQLEVEYPENQKTVNAANTKKSPFDDEDGEQCSIKKEKYCSQRSPCFGLIYVKMV